MPATGRAAINRAAGPVGKRRGRGHGPLLLSMIHPNGPWLGEGRPAVTHHSGADARLFPTLSRYTANVSCVDGVHKDGAIECERTG